MAQVPQMPRVFLAGEIEAEMAAIIARIHSLHEGLVSTVKPATACFANVFAPWIEVANEIDAKVRMMQLLSHAAQDPEIRRAAAKAFKAYGSTAAAWLARKDMFDLIKAAAAAARDEEGLDPESRYYAEDALSDFTASGHESLQGPELDMFISQRSKIEELKTAFGRNLREVRGGLVMTREELVGVPEEHLQKWKQDGEGEKSFFVPFGNGGWSTVMRYAQLESSRKRMFLAEEARLNANVPLFRDIVRLRDSQARTLGYSSHGDFRLQGRAIQSADYIKSLLERLKETLIPEGRRELQALEKVKAETNETPGGSEMRESNKIASWDMRYYRRLANKNLDDRAIAEFFPLETTMQSRQRSWTQQSDGMKTSKRGRSGGAAGSQEFIGFLYMDLFWREKKKKVAQNICIESGFMRPDRSRHPPATVLMCSIPQPTKSCALLQHSELVTIFHELGHGVHDLVSKTEHSRFHGTNLPTDFAEVPSLLLENWCWLLETLQQMSCHYTSLSPKYMTEWRAAHPGEPDPPVKLPAELQRQLLASRNANRGLRLLYHLHEEVEALDMQKLWYDLREEIEGFDFSASREQGHSYTSLNHLVSGYDLGFYSYLSCLAIAKDIFQTVFEKDPWDLEAWARYREVVLQPGGSQRDCIGLVTKLLGREPDFGALAKSVIS